MGWFDKLFGELIDVIDWAEENDELLAYHLPTRRCEIQSGATLVVREAQQAVLVYQGQIADRYGPGCYTLNAETMPVLATLAQWPPGTATPFKAEVYFFCTCAFAHLPWTLPQPITWHDAELGKLSWQATGQYTLRLNDPEKIMQTLLTTTDRLRLDALSQQLQAIIAARCADFVNDTEMTFLAQAANREQLASALQRYLGADFDHYGLTLEQFQIDTLALPAEADRALQADSRATTARSTDRADPAAAARRVQVHCPACGHPNDETARYCSQCGQKLFTDA